MSYESLTREQKDVDTASQMTAIFQRVFAIYFVGDIQ